MLVVTVHFYRLMKDICSQVGLERKVAAARCAQKRRYVVGGGGQVCADVRHADGHVWY